MVRLFYCLCHDSGSQLLESHNELADFSVRIIRRFQYALYEFQRSGIGSVGTCQNIGNGGLENGSIGSEDSRLIRIGPENGEFDYEIAYRAPQLKLVGCIWFYHDEQVDQSL